MFRWCAYCLRFLGESAPWADFASSHGVCSSCEGTGCIDDAEALARVRPVIELGAELLRVAERGLDLEGAGSVATRFLERGRALGLRPADMLLGVVQPALYEVGRRWSQGLLDASMEARLTIFCESVLDALVVDQMHRAPPVTGRTSFLLVAEGNRHTLGIRIFGFVLRESGRDVRVVVDPQEPSWVARLVRAMDADVVGVSLADPADVAYAGRVASALRDAGLDTRTVVGGFGARDLAPDAVPEGVRVVVSFSQL
ncbi:MAG: cobalamin B12-binding domain-containing protein [Polyangiaceae bacterium]